MESVRASMEASASACRPCALSSASSAVGQASGQGASIQGGLGGPAVCGPSSLWAHHEGSTSRGPQLGLRCKSSGLSAWRAQTILVCMAAQPFVHGGKPLPKPMSAGRARRFRMRHPDLHGALGRPGPLRLPHAGGAVPAPGSSAASLATVPERWTAPRPQSRATPAHGAAMQGLKTWKGPLQAAQGSKHGRCHCCCRRWCWSWGLHGLPLHPL